MFKQITQIVSCLALILGSLFAANANTLSGYAVRQKGPNINAKMPGALIEFKDAATMKPVEVKMKAGVEIKDRKDAFYALSAGDIGRWWADVRPGRYIVTITGGTGEKTDTYSLNLNALPTGCPATNGYLDVTACGATGSPTGDDTQAIKDGVAALAAIGGGRLFFPKGTYRVGTVSHTAVLLPIDLPSGITIEGISGGGTGTAFFDNCRILMEASAANQVHLLNKAVFTIGENRRQITMRDISINSKSNTSDPYIPGSVGLLAEGNYPNTTLGILFSNMTFWGFTIGIDVKGCTKDHVVGIACVVDPKAEEPEYMVPWQFDNVKADHVTFGNKIGVQMDTDNSDWNFSSSWFHIPPDNTPANQTPTSSGLNIKRGGFIHLNNSFAGSPVPNQPGGNFIFAGSVGTLMITNSQAENIKNSILWGRDRLPGEPIYDLGSTAARIMVIGSEFGAPVKLRYRVTYISTGNHYGYNTIDTDTPLIRVYSTGDKFCGDGLIPNNAPCPNPGVVGPGTVVFNSGAPAEISLDGQGNPTPGSIQEIPAQFGVRSIFSKEVEANGKVTATKDVEVTSGSGTGPLLKVNSWDYNIPLFRVGQPNFYYDFKRNPNNGFLLLTANQGIPYKGVTLNGVLQLDPDTTYNDLVTYANAFFNGLPVISNGAILYCKDCGVNSSNGDCTSGGSGALAKRINAAWKCN